MIVIGIPYNKYTVIALIVLEAGAAVFLRRKSYAANTGKKIWHMAAGLAIVLAVAFIAVCGIAPVLISNDTMYFYRRYPDCIVYYQGLRDQFDFWMTDTGLCAVAIDTLPALFGFGESFGIREFFNVCFIVFFGTCVYERSKEYLERRSQAAAAVIITGVLAVSTPFVILGHWALANMYFMELFFMAAYYTFSRNGRGFGASALLLTALALFRIEGTMFVVWLVICLAFYCNDIGKKLAGYVMVPVLILFGGYCLKIFTQFYLFDNIYLFLTPPKAVALVAAIAGCAIYTAYVAPRLPGKIAARLPGIYIGAMIAGNVILCLYDREHYIGNIKAFYANLFRQSGWGMLPYFVISASLVFGIEYAIRYRKNKEVVHDLSFSAVLTAGFALIALAAAFGRGDILTEDVGDSGNRVLLQITPLVVMLFGELGMRLAGAWEGKIATSQNVPK